MVVGEKKENAAETQENAAARLPYNLMYAYHSSDGRHLVVAGGEEDDRSSETLHDEFLVLEGEYATWRPLLAYL